MTADNKKIFGMPPDPIPLRRNAGTMPTDSITRTFTRGEDTGNLPLTSEGGDYTKRARIGTTGEILMEAPIPPNLPYPRFEAVGQMDINVANKTNPPGTTDIPHEG